MLAAAAALATGCFGGLKNEAQVPNIYRLDAPQLESGATLPVDLSVVVERTAPGLDGDRIAGRWPDGRLDYIANARWADQLTRILQSALVESFQESGRLRSVQGDVGRFRATHALVIEVRRFEADYTAGGSRSRRWRLLVTLGRISDRQVLASFTPPRARTRRRTGRHRWSRRSTRRSGGRIGGGDPVIRNHRRRSRGGARAQRRPAEPAKRPARA